MELSLNGYQELGYGTVKETRSQWKHEGILWWGNSLYASVQRYRSPQRFHGYGKAGTCVENPYYFLQRTPCSANRGHRDSRSLSTKLGSTLQNGSSPQWNQNENIINWSEDPGKENSKSKHPQGIPDGAGDISKRLVAEKNLAWPTPRLRLL